MNEAHRRPLSKLSEYFGLKGNIVVLLVAIVAIGAGEEIWMRFLPKYLKELGAAVWVIGLFDSLKTLLGALYAYPGGIATDHWGHKRALVSFTVISIAGYVTVLAVPHWGGVIAGSFLFLAWSCFSLPATFSLIGSTLHENKLSMGIGVQSVVKRFPIVIGPIIGGILVDHFGIIRGVQFGLVITITLAISSIFIQKQIKEEPLEQAKLSGFWSTVSMFPPELRRLLFSDILIRFCERIPFVWVVIYAMDHVGVSGKQIGLLTGLEMFASIICLIPAAHLSDRYGREPFVLATFICFTLFPLTLLVADSFGWLILAFAIRGLKEFGEPARKALIITYSSKQTRGRMVGAYYLIRDLLVTSGSFIGAALWKFGPEVNFLASTLVGVAGTIIYIRSLSQLRTS